MTGRQQPELGGIRLFGSAIIFSAQNTPDAVTVSGAFIGPATGGIGAGEVGGDRVAALGDAQLDGEGLVRRSRRASMTPSPSKMSVNSASPSGSARSAARIIVSE